VSQDAISLSGNELLAAVDVKCCARDRAVTHHLDGQRGDVSGPNYASDWQRLTQLPASSIDLIAQERG
jgi:hypothetical protein